MPIDGSAPTKLAERATPYMTHLDDGRLLGTVGVGSRWLGALVLVDTHSRAETRVDDRVHSHWHDASRVNDEGIVTYSVRDGDRSGVYVARLPAAP